MGGDPFDGYGWRDGGRTAPGQAAARPGGTGRGGAHVRHRGRPVTGPAGAVGGRGRFGARARAVRCAASGRVAEDGLSTGWARPRGPFSWSAHGCNHSTGSASRPRYAPGGRGGPAGGARTATWWPGPVLQRGRTGGPV